LQVEPREYQRGRNVGLQFERGLGFGTGIVGRTGAFAYLGDAGVRGNDVSNISYKDITMDGVTKASISISEYYPQVMPTGPVPAVAVSRLTPHFHNIRIENVKGINAAWAGAIVGLPESHVDDIILKNVNIEAKKGMQVGYADVTSDGLTITTTDGSKPIDLGPEGKVSEAKK